MQFKVYLLNEEKDSKDLLGVLEDEDLKVGREVEAGHILIKKNSVSREHGTFKYVNGRWYYSDLGSSNGSFAESRRLVEGEYFEIVNGLMISISDQKLLFETFDAGKHMKEKEAAVKIDPSNYNIQEKKTYVFTPGMLENLRSDSGIKKTISGRPANRSRRITDADALSFLNNPNAVLVIITMLFLGFVIFFILLFLFM